MSSPCEYPDLKDMLKDMVRDLKESYKKEIEILEANIKANQFQAVQEAKDMVSDVEKDMTKISAQQANHDAKINKLFEIVDEIRDSYQQALGAFKFWGALCGFATMASAGLAIFSAIRA